MIFILNKQEKVINILKNKGGLTGESAFFDDQLVQDLATGAETFTFSTVLNNSVAEDIVVGNYVAFQDGKDYKLFQIVTITSDHSQQEIMITVYCETAGLDLIQSVFLATKIDSCSLERFMRTALDGTEWEVGALDASLTSSVDLNLDDASVYTTLQNTIPKYKGEMAFRVELVQGAISKKYIDVYAQRGRFTGKRFEFGKDITDISKKVDSSNLYTALIGKGTDNIDFSDITVEGINKPAGQNFVADEQAFQRYNKNGKHLMGIFKFDTKSPQELLRKTYEQLQKVKTPQITYNVSIVLLGRLLGESWNTVNIGDTVEIVDHSFNPPIFLEARVSKLTTSMTDPNQNSCTFTNFVEVESGITPAMKALAKELKGYTDSSVSSKFPIGSSDIQDGAVKTQHIYKSSISTDLLQADCVETNNIKANAITTDKLASKSVTSDKIDTKLIDAVSAKFTNLETQNATINKALIGKADISTLDTIDATINQLKTDKADISALNVISENVQTLDAKLTDTDKLIAGKADIKDLNTTNENVQSLNAKVGEIDTLKSDVATINNLVTEKADIKNLETTNANIEKLQGNIASFEKTITGEVDATKGSIDNLESNNAKITNLISGNLTSDNIKAGSIESTSLASNSITADKIASKTITADSSVIADGAITNAMIGDAQISSAKIQQGAVGSLAITDGAIISTKIGQAQIENGHIKDATIDDAKILSVSATKITAGEIDTGKVKICSTDGKMTLQNNTMQVIDSNNVVRVQIGEEKTGDYGIIVLNAQGQAIFDSNTGVNNLGIADNAVETAKIKDQSITPSKIVIDQLFADQATIQALQATSIRAEQITTGIISSDRINLNGLVSFNALNLDLAKNFVFDTKSNRTYINGGALYTNSVTADKVNVKGLNVTNKTGATTLNVTEDGEIYITGNFQSSNYSDIAGKETGYKITADGNAIFNNTTVRGNVILPNAGMANDPQTSNLNVTRIWAGDSYENKEKAPFQVLSDGTVKAKKGEFGGTFTGVLNIGNIHISDTNTSSAKIQINTNNDLETKIQLGDSQSFINDRLVLGNFENKKVEFDVDNNLTSFYTSSIFINGDTTVKFNQQDGSILTASYKNNNNSYSHNVSYDSKGTVVIDNNSQSQTNESDFKFTKQGGTQSVVVEVEGTLNVNDNIRFGNMRLEKRNEVGNEGIDFII